ncbi:OLC1v1032321C1 [Oldenlandia corymbosa var. corymbosa]|uniref:OLC1v1032321C1 n=1 Tax=Oldenlandia corymbosa var. corymbosa TaxID=529605 RepID=A0AAV1CLH9_OLDCO|nr:OLC1v1032321C1 [Oldenlandia corymbosa var. corymbosa]
MLRSRRNHWSPGESIAPEAKNPAHSTKGPRSQRKLKPNGGGRASLWAELNDLSDSIDSEWIILGDFNCLASAAKRLNRRTVTAGNTIELQSFMAKHHITDLPHSGNFFTWTNKHQTGSRICSKLDRILVNSCWMTSLQAHASFLAPGVSDHSPGIAELLPEKVVHPPFRFCNFWTNEDDFIPTVSDSWLSNLP